MVDNYNRECGYLIPNLKKHILIFDDSILRYIDVDNGIDKAEILNQPTLLTGFSISYNEETSLDERYKFTKQLNISVNDKVDVESLFNGKYYVVVEDLNENHYLLNPDFKLRYAYTYTLQEGINQTDITLQTDSNFPLLKIELLDVEYDVCNSYRYPSIKSLQMIESNKAKWDSNDNILRITDSLKTVEYNRNSLSFQESYNGDKVTSTLSFNLPLHSANESWPYNLLEFQENKYTAIITTTDNEQIVTGIYFGLQPNYTINGNDSENNSNYEITLTEVSNNSSISLDLTLEELLGHHWEYIQILDGKETWVCNSSHGFGMAEIWVMAEVDNFGNQTGRYKVLDEIYEALYGERDPDIDYSYYDDNFGWIRQYNVIGPFDTQFPVNWFPTYKCAAKEHNPKCFVTSTIENGSVLTTGKTISRIINASCDWEIININNLSITPTTGTAKTNVIVNITPTDVGDASFSVSCCNSTINYSFGVDDGECITPLMASVNCLGGTLIFDVKDGCELSNIQCDLPYKILDNGNLQVTVPQITSGAGTSYFITLDCCDVEKTIQIMQGPVYSFWGCMEDDCGYICVNGSKYAREWYYTGATSTEWNRTDIYRAGALIESNSKDCRSLTRYSYSGNNYCIDGQEYKLMEEETSYDNGETWTKTGVVKLGDFISPESSDYKGICSETPTYEWRLTNETTCVE